MLDVATLSNSIDTIAKLIRVLEKAGVTAKQLTLPINDEVARNNLAVYLKAGCPKLLGQVHIIDCDIDPFVPKGWEVEEHHKTGRLLELDVSKIQLYLSEEQRKGEVIKGNELRKKLTEADRLVLNACVLDYLLIHQELIPDDWKEKRIFFFGTIYRGGIHGSLRVRCFRWAINKWIWDYEWLTSYWVPGCHVAVALIASNE